MHISGEREVTIVGIHQERSLYSPVRDDVLLYCRPPALCCPSSPDVLLMFWVSQVASQESEDK